MAITPNDPGSGRGGGSAIAIVKSRLTWSNASLETAPGIPPLPGGYVAGPLAPIANVMVVPTVAGPSGNGSGCSTC